MNMNWLPDNLKPVGTLFGATGATSVIFAIDTAHLFTITLTLMGALVSGLIASRFVKNEAEKEIDSAFSRHTKTMHDQHNEFVEAITERKA